MTDPQKVISYLKAIIADFEWAADTGAVFHRTLSGEICLVWIHLSAYRSFEAPPASTHAEAIALAKPYYNTTVLPFIQERKRQLNEQRA
jgi:hypothetical protein